MSYGFEVRNASGAIVIDSEFPSVFLGQETTITGTKVFLGYDVWGFTFPQTGYAPFFNVPVGEWVTYSGVFTKQPIFYGSQPTFTTRKAVFLGETTYTPDDYGMEIYNASGDPLFSSSENLIPVVGFTNDLENNPSQGQFSGPIQWVCPISSKWALIPTQFQNEVLLNNFVIRRVSSSSFDVTTKTIGSITGGPAVAPSIPVKAIFAG